MRRLFSRRYALHATLAWALLFFACGGNRFQSALDPAGPNASELFSDGSRLFWVSAIAYVITIAVLIVAAFRARRETTDEAAREKKMAKVVAAGGALVTLTLIALLIGSVVSDRAIGSLATRNPDVYIIATGNQWWWDFEYQHPDASKSFHTANELHIPVGHTVRIRTRSTDVIHSFWVPNLAGKKDLIPGHETALYLRADKPGVYRGQCAEFCGLQHAHMSFIVVAEPFESYARWIEGQRQPAPEPQSVEAKRGRDFFLAAPCAMCHAIGGTPASARLGPDLTHVASRRTLGAATIANNRDNLAAWIVDPQHFKPGNHMPANVMTASNLNDLLAYVGSLR